MESHNNAIVTCARSWLGTRFVHQGRLKKTAHHTGGVDCLGLLIGVASELGLTDQAGRPLTSYDDTHYTHTPDTTELRHYLNTLLTVKATRQLAPGNIGLFTMDSNPQHLAIIGADERGDLTLIHAYAQARKVVEHALDDAWRQSLIGGYAMK